MSAKIKSMPHSIEAEQSVLGCVLFDNGISVDIMSELKQDDFYVESHKIIFDTMYKIYLQNRPIDFVTLTSELEISGNLNMCGGITYITTINQVVPSSANFKYYMDIVKRDSVMRSLIRASQDIIHTAQTDIEKERALEYAEKSIFDISASTQGSKLEHVAPSIVQVIEKFDTLQRDKSAFRGITTGFPSLDYVTNGLQRTDLVLIAARPAVGKTSFAMNIVQNAAVLGGHSCAVFSLEMPAVQIAQRMLCSGAEVDMSKANKGKLEKDDWKRLWEESARLNKAKIYIDDSSLITPAEILSKCRRLKAKDGLDLIMIDYIQLMSMGRRGSESRQSEISEISRSLKILAKEINVPVLALSQLSRAVEKRGADAKPMLSDLRESGAIEQDADIVMFLHKTDADSAKPGAGDAAVDKDLVELIIAKHRNGSTCSLDLKWFGKYTKFRSVDRHAE